MSQSAGKWAGFFRCAKKKGLGPRENEIGIVYMMLGQLETNSSNILLFVIYIRCSYRMT